MNFYLTSSIQGIASETKMQGCLREKIARVLFKEFRDVCLWIKKIIKRKKPFFHHYLYWLQPIPNHYFWIKCIFFCLFSFISVRESSVSLKLRVFISISWVKEKRPCGGSWCGWRDRWKERRKSRLTLLHFVLRQLQWKEKKPIMLIRLAEECQDVRPDALWWWGWVSWLDVHCRMGVYTIRRHHNCMQNSYSHANNVERGCLQDKKQHL